MTEKYYTLKENAIWNFPGELVTKAQFTCTLDGKDVQGMVRFDAKNISVTISDQKWFHFNDAHIMYMCPKIYTQRNVKGSPASHYGVMRLKNLIVDLYHDNLRVSENLDQIKDCLIEYNHHVESINNRLEALEEEMIATRKATVKASIHRKNIGNLDAVIILNGHRQIIKSTKLLKSTLHR